MLERVLRVAASLHYSVHVGELVYHQIAASTKKRPTYRVERSDLWLVYSHTLSKEATHALDGLCRNGTAHIALGTSTQTRRTHQHDRLSVYALCGALTSLIMGQGSPSW